MISLAIAARFSGCNIASIDTKLHKYAFSGDLIGIRETLSSLSVRSIQSLLDKRNHLGCTALRLAATGGHTESVSYLVKRGATVDTSDIKGQTPLFVAVKNNHLECVRVLLKYGANPEGDDCNISTPMYTAAMNGSGEILKLLIKHGACLSGQLRDMRVQRTFGNDPLRVAVSYHKYNCCKILLMAGYDPGTIPLYHVAMHHKCDIRLLELFYEFGVSVYSKDQKGVYAWESTGTNQENYISYLMTIKDSPRSLLSTCRMATRKYVNSLDKIDELSLPVYLLDYLQFKDIVEWITRSTCLSKAVWTACQQ